MKRIRKETSQCQHTPCPKGDVAWHNWAKEMSKTHVQKKCPLCHLWAIWVPKPGEEDER